MDNRKESTSLPSYSLLGVVFLFLQSVAVDSISAVTSKSTPAIFQRDLSTIEVQYLYPLKVLKIEEISDSIEGKLKNEVVIDVLNNEFLSAFVHDVATSNEVINGNEYDRPGQRRLFHHRKTEVRAMSSVLRWLEVNKVAVFLSETNMRKEDFEESFFGIQISYFTISDNIEARTLELLLRRQITSQGITSVVIWLHPLCALKLVQAIFASRLYQVLSSVILSLEAALALISLPESLPEIMRTGPVFIIDSGCEETLSNADFIVCKLHQLTHFPPSESFSVMSLHSGQPLVIGQVLETGITMTQEVRFFRGNSTAFALSAITVSFNNGTLNPSGEAGTSEPFDYVGVQIAVSDVNADSNVLPFYTLRISNLTLGLFEFDYDWEEQQLAKVPRQELGVAMITGMYSSVAIDVYRLLKSKNIRIPQVGATNTAPKLSSKKEFPLYSRVAMSDAFMSVLYGRMLQHYGWKHIAVVYCDDPWSIELYYLISNETQKLGITTHNNESTRQVLTDIKGNHTDFLATFKDVIDTNVRIVILILYGQTLYKSLEALYDLGMRRGDLFFLATEWLDPTLFEIEDLVLRSKIKELCHGAVQFFPATKIGQIGATMSQEYFSLMHRDSSFFSCFYYDATLLIAHAIDYLSTYGGDYTSPDTLNHAIRSTRFRGCTGIVTIIDGKNDRFPMMYGILNAQIAINGSYEIKRVGTYDPAGLVLFNFSSPIIWPDNTTATPKDMRRSIDCPFEEKDRKLYKPGLLLELVVVFSVFLIGVMVALIGWKCAWQSNADSIMQRSEISFDDYIHFATIWIESLQYASLGLTIPSWAFLLPALSDGLTLNLSALMSLRNGGLWMLLDWIISAVCLWMMLIIVTWLNFKEKSCLCTRFSEIGEMTLPLLGNVCFLPIVCSLLSVFECEEVVSRSSTPSLADTILEQDCYEKCWRYPHVAYVACCSVLLLIYLPSAILLRPYWQDRQPYLHISTSPAYLMLKTVYQLLLILLSKTTKLASHLLSSVLFLLSTLALCLITLRKKPYGYGRSNLWHFVSLICLIYLALLSIISDHLSSPSSSFWLILLYSLLFLILLSGLLWQFFKVPPMLFRPKGLHVVELFRFMFARGSEYLYIFNRTTQTKPEALNPHVRHATLFDLRE